MTTDTTTAPEPSPMQDAYDAFFRAAEQLALLALHDAATIVREACPAAVAMRIDWSDQGDYLEPCAYPLTADGDPIEDDDREDWIEVDNASALDESNRSTWEAYAGVEGRDGRREAEASGYVFPLDAILTDLAPAPVDGAPGTPGEVLFPITRATVEERAGRPLTADEADRFSDTFGLTSVLECIDGWLDGAGIQADDEAEALT